MADDTDIEMTVGRVGLEGGGAFVGRFSILDLFYGGVLQESGLIILDDARFRFDDDPDRGASESDQEQSGRSSLPLQ